MVRKWVSRQGVMIACFRLTTAGCLTVLLAAATALPAFADTDEISELSAKWWQWAERNGFPDQDAFVLQGDVDCSGGQRGNVWFLAGLGEDNYDPDNPPGEGEPGFRTCINRIPAGKRLFFPLVNTQWYNPESACANDFCTVAEKRELADGVFSDIKPGPFGSRACYLSAAVDGRPVIYDGIEIARTQSPPYRGTGVVSEGDPEVISDGYWVLLPPLSRGDHTIDFTGAFCSFDGFDILFGIQIRYELTVGGRRHGRH